MIIADFSEGLSELTTEKLYQWDIGQQLQISGISAANGDMQVHFANLAMKQAIVKDGEYSGGVLTVDIPNEFLQVGGSVPGRAWLYCYDADNKAKTVKTIYIPIVARNRPNDYVSPEDPDSKGIVDRAMELLENYETDLAGKLSSAAGAVKTANIDTGAVTEAKLAPGVIDSTLSVSGKAAEAKNTGDAIAALNGALSKTTVVSPNLFGGVLASDTRYISTPAPVHTIPEQNYKAGEFEIPDGTSFIAANSYWFGGTYCYYTNENYERISLVKDSLTSNFVYTVPSGAKKVCFSFNGNDSTLSAKLNSSGIVILAGSTAIPNATIDTYPYRGAPVDYFHGDELLIASQGSRKLKDILSSVPYSKISDEFSSLTNGSYTANGGTLSGNTVTVTAAYQGILSNEFVLENGCFKIIVNATFNVPRCILRFQYYDTAWRTVDIARSLTSGTEFEAVVDVSSCSASKFRILIQNASVTSGVTNTITVNSLTVYDFSEVQASPYYDAEFETMLGKIFDGIEDKVYTCLKSGGDFNSLVTAINTLTQRKNATLYIGPGEWNIIDELGETYMNNVSSSNSTWGLVLKNGIRLIGATRSVITAKYSGSNSAMTTYFSVFNAGTGGFTLENINVEDENIRYSVHDDRGTDSDNEHYVNRYINCRMKHINGNYSDCIGGGLGIDGLIEITGCYFEGDVGRPRLAYYHGNNKPNEENAQCKIVVKDCYFANDGTFKLTHYGASTKVSTAFCCGNSFGSAPEVNTGSSAPHENMQLLAWNNEIR